MHNKREVWIKRLYDLTQKDPNKNDPNRGIHVGRVGNAEDTVAIARYWKDHDYIVLWRDNGPPEDPLGLLVRLNAKGIDYVETLSQKPSVSPVLPAPPPKGKFRVLFLGPRPINEPALRLKEEVHKIIYRLRTVDTVELVEKWGVQFTDIPGYLLSIKPEIVHISGHGTVGQEFIFENDKGEAEYISQEALSALFSTGPARRHTRCIVLNSCYLEDTARVISQHIDFVIGTKDPIQDSAAVAFAESFYETLAHGESINDAFEIARSQFIAKKHHAASVPVLHIRNGADLAFKFISSALQALTVNDHGSTLLRILDNPDKSFKCQLTIHGKPRSGNSPFIQLSTLTEVDISSNSFTIEFSAMGRLFQLALPINAIEQIWKISESHHGVKIQGRMEIILRSSQSYGVIYLP